MYSRGFYARMSAMNDSIRVNLAIVVSEFNNEITERMLERACSYAKEMNTDVRYVCYAPGSFDIPLLVDTLLSKDDVDAVVALGAVIKGSTMHDEMVAYNASRLIADLALKHGKPVTLGISGPGMSYEQAVDRINPVSTRAVKAAVDMVRRLRLLKYNSGNDGEGTVVIR